MGFPMPCALNCFDKGDSMNSSVGMVNPNDFRIKGQHDFQILKQSLSQTVDMSFLENQKKDVLANLQVVEKKLKRITKLRELKEKGELAVIMGFELSGKKINAGQYKQFLDDEWTGFSSVREALVSMQKELSKRLDQLNKTIEANLELEKNISEYEKEFGAIDNLVFRDLF